MLMIIYMTIFAAALSGIMITVNLLISKKTYSDREKSSPFECGFDPKNKARLPFSMHFFIIAVIFLIFDVEITLLMPMIYTLKITNMKLFSFMFSYFLIILVIGVYHEWNQGALTWTN